MAAFDEWVDRTLWAASEWPVVGGMAERALERRGYNINDPLSDPREMSKALAEAETQDKYVPVRIPTDEDRITAVWRGDWIRRGEGDRSNIVGIGGIGETGYRVGVEHRFNLGPWEHKHTTWLKDRFETEQSAIDHAKRAEDLDRYVAKHGGEWSVELVKDFFAERSHKAKQANPEAAELVGPRRMVSADMLRHGSRIEADNAIHAANTTDWWASFSDDANVRAVGTGQIRQTYEAFEKLAERGPTEAHLASVIWDRDAPQEFAKFPGYVSPDRQYLQFEDVMTKISSNKQADTYWQELSKASSSNHDSAANTNRMGSLKL